MAEPLLEAVDVVKHFAVGRSRAALRAVDGVSFSIAAGETLGLVGESGCGKSTLGRLAIRMIQPDSGAVLFDGHDIAHAGARALSPIRPRLQMVYQDPMGSLNPRLTVGASIAEPLLLAGRGTSAERRDRARAMLELVGLARADAERYPHEFSGGQRQRICIARALVSEPAFIVADEPVSALDMSVRAQIINLLMDLQERLDVSYLFVSHDLTVVRHVARRVAVMYLGRIVESGPATEVLLRPLHPYTRSLLASIPPSRPRPDRQRVVVEGEPPSPIDPPPGCAFHPRCPIAVARCRVDRPLLVEHAPGHAAACHRADWTII